MRLMPRQPHVRCRLGRRPPKPKAGDGPIEMLRTLQVARRSALLCGVAPIPASSGKTNRHRLNRGGDRDANRVLHLLAVGRMGWDPVTRAYVERRTTEAPSKKEILRCLKAISRVNSFRSWRQIHSWG
jgi:transposase